LVKNAIFTFLALIFPSVGWFSFFYIRNAHSQDGSGSGSMIPSKMLIIAMVREKTKFCTQGRNGYSLLEKRCNQDNIFEASKKFANVGSFEMRQQFFKIC
jgi:hypothetical protein